MTNEDRRKFAAELDGLSVDELNARNEELEQQRLDVRERQKTLVEVRARRMRADRIGEGGQHVKAGVAEVKGTVKR